MKTKEDIRRHYLSLRDNLSFQAHALASAKICKKILSLPRYQEAEHIGLYQAIRKEVSLEGVLLDAFSKQKKVYLPVIEPPASLHFVQYENEATLLHNRFNIPEPVSRIFCPIGQLDILLVPLVAFDQNGTRLGWGKGYYDRALMTERPKAIIGVAYTFQRYAQLLPCEISDVPLDGVVTEASFIEFN